MNYESARKKGIAVFYSRYKHGLQQYQVRVRSTAIPRVAVFLSVIITALLLVTPVALAHSFLVQSKPQAGERLTASPNQLMLQFSEKLAPLHGDSVIVKSPSGQEIHIGTPMLSQGGSTVTTSLPRLQNGVYIVDWHVISGEDGHPTMGEFAFGVGAQVSSSLVSVTNAPTEWPDALAGWVLLIGLALAAGGIASDLFIWRPLIKEREWQVRKPPIRSALWLAFLGSAALFAVFAARLSGVHGVFRVINPSIIDSALSQPGGALALGTMILTLFSMVLIPFRKLWSVSLAVLVGSSVAVALRTHPALKSAGDAVVMSVHVTFAIMWVGALIHLAVVLSDKRLVVPREVLISGVKKYSRLAVWTVLLLFLTGIIAALSQFSTFGQLTTTTYGIVLLIKLGLVIIALLFAVFARKQTVAKSERAFGRGFIGSEISVLVLILAVSALLGNVSPPEPVSAPAQTADLLGPPPVEGPSVTVADRVGWMEVYLTASTDRLTMHVIGPKGDAPQGIHFYSDDTSGNAVYANTPSGKNMGLALRSFGSGYFTAPIHWGRGETTITMDLRTKDWTGGEDSLVVAWPPMPTDPGLFEKVIDTMKHQATYSVKVKVSSGPGSAFTSTLHSSGNQFLEGEPYSTNVTDIRQWPSQNGYRQLVGYESGSNIWFHMWIDNLNRIHHEVIVAPGHLVENTYQYSSK